MLEIKFVRQNISEVKKAFENRGERVDLDSLLATDERHRARLLEVETLRHQRNSVSEKIAGLKRSGENADDLVTEIAGNSLGCHTGYLGWIDAVRRIDRSGGSMTGRAVARRRREIEFIAGAVVGLVRIGW